MRWLFLILASCCEIGWFYSIRYLNHLSFEQIYKFHFLDDENAIGVIIALIGYVLFGILNIIFFAKAIQKIPASVAFAVWTGFALLGSTMIDVFVLKEDITFTQELCVLCILVGIVGMKYLEIKKGRKVDSNNK